MSSFLRLALCVLIPFVIGSRALAANAAALSDDDLYDAAADEARAGDFAESEKSWTEYIRREPKVPEPYYLRGIVRHELGKFAEAETDYDVFVSLEPQQARGFVRRAETRLEQGNVAGAIADAGISLRLENLPRALRVRALAFMAKGDHEAALKDLNQALEWNESDDDLRVIRSDCYLYLGRIEEARTDLEQAVEQNPGDSFFAERFADLLFHSQQFEQALEAYENVARMDADAQSRASEMMGFCHYAAGRHEKAIDTLQQAIGPNGAISPWLGAVLHLSWQAAKRPGTSPLEGLLERMEDAWGKSICRVMLKQLGEDELIDEANAGKTLEERNGRLCEAYFYLGASRLLQGDRIAGRALLSEAVETGSRVTMEYTAAKVELARSATK
jgi:Lipoprotein NlpI, contains TPR repeats